MNLTTAAIVVILGVFILGALIGFFVPGKKNKKIWYLTLMFFGLLLSGFFALGAYVFTQNSIFFFASKQVGIITFGGSLLTFGIVFFMFVMGVALGDIHHHRKKTEKEVSQILESSDKLQAA